MLDVLLPETEITRTMVNLRLKHKWKSRAGVLVTLGQQAEVIGEVEEGFTSWESSNWWRCPAAPLFMVENCCKEEERNPKNSSGPKRVS